MENKDIAKIDNSIKLVNKLLRQSRWILAKAIFRIIALWVSIITAFVLAYNWYDWKMLLIVVLVAYHFKLIRK